MIDIEKLIEDLRGLLKQYGEKIPYGELVGAPWPYSRAGDLVWQDPEPYFIEQAITAITDLLARAEAAEARAEKAERERDASIKELDDVSSAIDDLSDFIDEKIFPTVQYDIYTSLRDNADSISMWKYEKDWRGTKEE